MDERPRAPASLVLGVLAPWWIREDVRKLRTMFSANGQPTLDAGFVVTECFAPTDELSAVASSVEQAVEDVSPFVVRTLEPRLAPRGEGWALELPLERPERAADLGDRLGLALYGRGVRAAEPVVRVLDGAERETAERALTAARAWRVNLAWAVRDVDLLGLCDGRWETLVRAHFGRTSRQ